ncbi:RelA/SpoT domain-containing protein [Paraburkholderia nemoris]|jgi:Uncharacterized protein conserved in bacteria|uniref:RelA/SpoT domain-containing protein n=1 Tax=Paraburkholderia nemoris TaxID=2793076 RepID=UPI001B267277|nr:RelA/SpoT domain-containing protein [Paraburkholderia nemoris]CAE6812037.1 hypothetical protein LMG22931_05917 [Paraburkholderia nemoris]
MKIGARTVKTIDACVKHFKGNEHLFATVLDQLNGYVLRSPTLRPHVHSVKSRVKDAEHLREKLMRKARDAAEKGEVFDITPDNLFSKINDLAGFRILHLYTTQIKDIDIALRDLFEEARFPLIEGPISRTWDDEYRSYFVSLGFGVKDSPNLYTSTHYVVQANSRSGVTCEIQVRNLMEEVWGEVDHSINYPKKTDSHTCREQIKVLARLTSSCSRLVDSIFSSHADANRGTQPAKSASVNRPAAKKRTK